MESEEQQQLNGWKLWKVKLTSFFIECGRVLSVTKKPTNDEFKTVVKVSGAGILLIGLLGFFVMLITSFVKLW